MSSKSRLTVLAMATLTLALFAGAAEPPVRMSTKELKALIANAKTPEEHMRLAEYYRGEAERLEAKQQEHQSEAAEYYRDPSRHPVPKYPTYGQHCRDLAYNYGTRAQKARALAAAHEAMAAPARDGSGVAAAAVSEQQHGAPAPIPKPDSDDMDCSEMMAEPGQTIADLRAMDAQLEQKVAAMNAASGSGKVEAMAAVINEMASQRKALRERMLAVESNVAGHTGGATSAQPDSMNKCPMMKDMAK
jgi:hypothetical protein